MAGRSAAIVAIPLIFAILAEFILMTSSHPLHRSRRDSRRADTASTTQQSHHNRGHHHRSDHRDTTNSHPRRHNQSGRQSTTTATSLTSTSSGYHLPRPGGCATNDVLFLDCYLCGQMSYEPSIYDGCCREEPGFKRYCTAMLS